MKKFKDYDGREVLLSAIDEQHIVSGHYEIGVLGADRVIRETLELPDLVVSVNRSLQYFRMYRDTLLGDKYVRLVVTEDGGVRNIRTAFVTARVVKGQVRWEREA